MELTDKTRMRSFMITSFEKCMLEKKYNYYTFLPVVEKLNPVYAAWCLEESQEHNKHMHIYLEFENQRTVSSIKKKLGNVHIEPRYGNPSECREYVNKSGKHEHKADTQLEPMQEFGNWDKYKDITTRGRLPKETDADKFDKYIEQFNSIEELVNYDPCFVTRHRNTLTELYNQKKIKEFKENFCTYEICDNGEKMYSVNKCVSYLYGGSGVGKTHGINLCFGFDNVSMITNYPDRMIWDDYKDTSVLVLDEFRGQIPISQMLNLLDNKIVDLYCRYNNKPLLATDIILTSNEPFERLYPLAQRERPETWLAFKRRFTGGIWEMQSFKINGELKRYICLRSKDSDYPESVQHLVKYKCPVSTENNRVIWIYPEEMDKLKEQYMK